MNLNKLKYLLIGNDTEHSELYIHTKIIEGVY